MDRTEPTQGIPVSAALRQAILRGFTIPAIPVSATEADKSEEDWRDFAGRIARGEEETIPPTQVMEMAAWFAAHYPQDATDDWDKPGAETPAFCAFLLRGGRLGMKLASAYVASLEGEERAEADAFIAGRLASDRAKGDPESYIDPVCPDCGVALEWGGESGCNRCGSKAEPQMPAGTDENGTRWFCDSCDTAFLSSSDSPNCPKCGAASTARWVQNTDEIVASDSVEGWDEIVITPVAGYAEILAGDAGPRGLLRVRQYAAQCDVRNQNGRIYPRAVLEAAILTAQPLARSGAMLSEFRHPTVAQADGEEKYVDNGPAAKTAAVDVIEMPDAEGRVYIVRTILDTPEGRKVADRFRSRRPYGISTRFKMRGDARMVGGVMSYVASAMQILTWDDVENPAVLGAGRFELLSDSVRASLQDTAPSGAGTYREHGLNSSDGSAGVERRARTEGRMNEKLKAKIARLFALRAAGDSAGAAALRTEIGQLIKLASDDDEDVKDASEEVMKYDSLSALQGYNGDRPAPRGGNARDVAGGGGAGYAPDATRGDQNPDGAASVNNRQSAGGDEDEDEDKDKDKTAGADEDKMTSEELAEWRKDKADREKAADDARITAAVAAACDSVRESDTALRALPSSVQDGILNLVKSQIRDPKSVAKAVSDQVALVSQLAADSRLSARGVSIGGAAGGQTTRDAAHPATVVHEPLPHMEGVDKLLAACDSYAQRRTGFNPGASDVRSRRGYNRRAFIDPMLLEYVDRFAGVKSIEEWFAKNDAFAVGGEKALCDAIAGQMLAAGDSSTLATMWNQPTILMTLIIQSYWDMHMMQYCEGIGPGLDDPISGMGGWATDPRIGTTLRVPSEYYEEPTGYGVRGPQFNALLQVPENGVFPMGQVKTAWLSYSATWMRLGARLTTDVVKALGNGPLNYSAVARHLYHIAKDKGRRVDEGLANEMLNASDEYGAVAVAAEAVNLTNNSSYAGGGSVTVNLNPAKTANAAVVSSTDDSVVYGTNAVGAVRVKGRGLATASPYFGTALGGDPIVPPRAKKDLTSQGQITTTTINPISIAGKVEGFLDDQGNVAIRPGQSAADYAVDYNNGVIVLSDTYGATGSSGILTSGVTIANYSYVTNFDNFSLTVPSGLTPEQYYNQLLTQADRTGALMGSAPRYMAPNFAVMSLVAATHIANASSFAPLLAVNGQTLYPTEDFFATRSGIGFARHAGRWRVGDKRIHLGRLGSTKYGVDTPFAVDGPHQAYDQATANPVDAKFYLASENNVICTPVVTKQDGSVLNPPSRAILLRK